MNYAIRVILLTFLTACSSQAFDESISGNAGAVGLYSLMRVVYPIKPSLDLRHGMNQVESNSTYNLGDKFRNTHNADEYFTVNNNGSYPLKIKSITLNTEENNFQLRDLPEFPLQLSSGESFKFSLSLTPASSGVKTGDILIVSDDEEYPQYTASFTLESVRDSRLSVTDGIFTLANNSLLNLGTTVKNTSGPYYTLKLNNSGSESLTINGINLQGNDAANFTLSSVPSMPYTIVSGGVLSVKIRFNAPSLLGTSYTVLKIQSNDPDYSNFNLNLRAESTNTMEPKIQVRVDGELRYSGDMIRFASNADMDPPACNGESIKIRIENIGPSNLIFDASTPLDLTGDGFQFTSSPSTPLPNLAPGAFYEYDLEFSTLSPSGMKYGNFTIKSNDSDSPAFSLDLQAKAANGSSSCP